MASWERHHRPLEPWGVGQLPMERARLWLVDLLWGFSSLFEILHVPVKGSKGYAHGRQQNCVCVSEYLHVGVRACMCVCMYAWPPPAVTDARLFLWEVWEGCVGRWVDMRVLAVACVKGSVWAVTWYEKLHLSKYADMPVNVFAYTGTCACVCTRTRSI